MESKRSKFSLVKLLYGLVKRKTPLTPTPPEGTVRCGAATGLAAVVVTGEETDGPGNKQERNRENLIP